MNPYIKPVLYLIAGLFMVFLLMALDGTVGKRRQKKKKDEQKKERQRKIWNRITMRHND